MQVLLFHKDQQSGFTVQPSCSFGDLKATAGMQFGLPEDSFKLLYAHYLLWVQVSKSVPLRECLHRGLAET